MRKRYKKESPYASEEEERRAKKYDKYMSFAKCMSPKELREAYVELMIELDEYRLKEFYRLRETLRSNGTDFETVTK